ncbi:MAG: hypothetical protein CUN49_07875 [Candidatus Thermofonsia Clade 1 bacterium]|jgi:hypothetical protein|uniref:Uncharacterized protein n=1 Tax=Candidatus Thermofonsia Clade 1 bacterium TaxID=2364210 RepID=A0A2M8PYY5_9CHLR|nr:MAG: hypothetical protein CUN49_07875 [Candidatus Thermofonsia Clade 1 bacterium]PJF42771.1 MAG: hypothetical protein CUN50_02930 [Candidatus Thermofonsia Clade 1 bacterium]RMF52369.1 MAG: hypothetical protein D6749_05085 [Chloroflexota bacterium]
MIPYEKPKRESQLERAFNFTDADLKQNMQGKLSEAQIARLRQEAYQILYLVVGALAIIGFLALLSFRATASELLLLLSCLIAPAVIAFVFTVGTTESALSARTVSKVSGMIHLAYGMMPYQPPLPDDFQPVQRGVVFGYQAAYRLAIADREFRIDREQYEALSAAYGYYNVFFVPTLNKIVAVQRIELSEPETIAGLPVDLDVPANVTRGMLDDEDQELLRG